MEALWSVAATDLHPHKTLTQVLADDGDDIYEGATTVHLHLLVLSLAHVHTDGDGEGLVPQLKLVLCWEEAINHIA